MRHDVMTGVTFKLSADVSEKPAVSNIRVGISNRIPEEYSL
jgi:hypothetical protein